jgi:hypothetical protein
MSPNFDKYFILYTFSSNTTFVVVLTQKYNEGNTFSSNTTFVVVLTQKYNEGNEYPIEFMSSRL